MSDSAGTPWAGRTLPAGDFAGDDGSADLSLVDALQQAADGSADDQAVVSALAQARIFVAVVAMLGEGAETRHGTADNAADMALMTLVGPDGRRALPVFSSVASLAAWDAAARPVPVQTRRAAVSAVTEGCDLMVLDAAGPRTFVVSRPALWALGADRDWLPAHQDHEVLAEIGRAVATEPDIVTFGATPGRTAQLQVTLVVREGLAAEPVREAAQQVADALQASDVVRERVDGVELRVQAGGA